MNSFRVVDLETTGLDPAAGDAIVELAWRDVPGKCRGHSTLVQPRRSIPVEAMATHHITERMVAEAPPREDAVGWMIRSGDPAEHCDRSEPDAWAAHNAAFERAFLPTLEPWLCTQRLAMHLWPAAPSHSLQVLRYWLALDAPEAEGAAPHRAMADVHVTCALLRAELAEYGGRPTVEELIRYAQRPVLRHVVNFGRYRGTAWADVPRDYLAWMLRQGDDAWDADTLYTVRYCLGEGA